MSGKAVRKILAEDNNKILYRKSLRKIAGSVTATILFQQFLYWFDKVEENRFYKFKTPCGHKLYTKGDSWTEELGFSIKEFDAAIKRIGTKLIKGVKKADILKKTDATGMIIYWIDRERVTWYEQNEQLIDSLLEFTYLSDQRSFSMKNTKGYLDKKVTDGHLHDLTDTTSKTTSDTPCADAKKEGGDSKKQQQHTVEAALVANEISATAEKHPASKNGVAGTPTVSLVDQTLTEFLRVTGWPMPTAKNRVLQYKKSIADHLDEKAFEGRLPDIYQAVWDQKREAVESGNLTLSAPGSFTNFMYNITNVEAPVREPSLNSLMNEGLVEMQEREPGVVTLVWVETGEIYDI